MMAEVGTGFAHGAAGVVAAFGLTWHLRWRCPTVLVDAMDRLERAGA